jgi:predicted DNA-binding transcriptional regulator YafY
VRHGKSAALLSLARTLAGSAEGMTLDEMAAEVSADRRTAERMRDAIRTVFPQMEELQDGPRKRFRISGGLDGFMQAPTADELAELHGAISALQAEGGQARAALLQNLAAKVQGALRAQARRTIAPDLEALMQSEAIARQVGPRPLADPAVLTTIRAALKASASICFTYGMAPETSRVRTASPWGLLYGRAYYMVGPEAGKAGPVLWRLDRISEPQFGGAADSRPEGWAIADFAAQSFGVFQEKPVEVVLRFSPAAAADAERFLFHSTQVMQPQEDGTLIVRFTAGGLLEMAHHLFSWGTEVDILSPISLRETVLHLLEQGLAHYSATGEWSKEKV